MNIESLWKNFKFTNCEKCKKECRGHLDYENLCSNLNYLKEYGEKNYQKNRKSLLEFEKFNGKRIYTFFSFGCGIGLDSLAVSEIFDNAKYYGIDECHWAIMDAKSYKNFQPSLPKPLKYDEGIFFLNLIKTEVVIMFFNSLFTISQNSDLENDLINALQNKIKFDIICDYTVNNNFHMPTEEKEFLDRLKKKLGSIFLFKELEILDGYGIIITGEKK